MKGTDILREYAKRTFSESGCAVKSSAIIGPLGKTCDDFRTCVECREFALNAIADQIERETLPRPLFEDGEPVDIGSYIGEIDGTDYGLTGEPVKRLEISAVHDSPGGEWAIRLEPGQVVKRPEPPDSWERIEADARKSTCDYYCRLPEGEEPACEYCPARGLKCFEERRVDLVRRCRALAEKEAGR